MISSVLARILLRYGAGAMAAIFLLSDDVAHRISTDPDVVQLVSLCLAFIGAVLSESLYVMAKRFGWRT